MGKTGARPSSSDVTLDAGALIALDRGNKRMIALLAEALKQRRSFRIPSGVVGQAWRGARTEFALGRFRRADGVEIVPLDEHVARSSGELCGATGTSDVIDASVVILARERGDIIVTSEADDLRRLDPT